MYCFGVFAHFSQFSMYAWGEKRKKVSFSRVYVCVKAKLTFVSFFFSFYFFAPFPKDGIQYLVLNVNMAIRSIKIHILAVNMSVYVHEFI